MKCLEHILLFWVKFAFLEMFKEQASHTLELRSTSIQNRILVMSFFECGTKLTLQTHISPEKLKSKKFKISINS